MITVFTPTFNRAYRLPDLYKSLLRQTSDDFEWIIVDDCSTDNTEELVKGWIVENKIKMRYFKQEVNGGKHRAVNRGVKEACGELFFIVDSDDYLTDDAIETISVEWSACTKKAELSGLCLRRMTVDKESESIKILGKDFPEYRCYGDSIEIAYEWGCDTDKAEVFRTDVLRKFPFPDIKGEKFCQEVVVWFKIAKKKTGKLLCVNKGIYVCEYLPDGLTSSFGANMRNNPKYSLLYALTLISIPQEWKSRKILQDFHLALWMIYRICFKRGKK